ncbi:MAG: hypothetical protein HC913_08355 [Microscillaceae bacterium]|nr:hypothetical protein [Microscillaceae bacterium]
MVNYKKILFFLLLGGGLWADPVSAQSALQQAQNHLHQKHPYLAQQPELGWVITDEIPNPRLGVVHLYLRQTYQGLEIKNANLNFTLQQGQVKQMSGAFVQKVSPRGLLKNPGLSEAQALMQAAQQLGLSGTVPAQRQTTPTKGTIFEGGQFSQDPIPVRLVYWALPDQSLRLAWEMHIHEHSGQNWWDVCVDAQTGQIIAKHNWVTKCQFDHAHAQDCQTQSDNRFKTSAPMGTNETAQYNVYPYPLESPNHGDRSLVTSPFNPLASPLGWHDTNGQTGAEHTITRGNNVYAYEDRNSDNQPGYSPNGGSGLNFDFPFDQEATPVDNQDAVITNLFYWNNFIHDVFHFYGFDEISGNFQVNNYGGLGAGNDEVRAEAQDGSGLNNANFGTPPDGNRPRMQMFLWNTAGGGFVLTVNAPTAIAGEYTATGASFGPLFLAGPISGAVVLAQPNLACEPFTNASSINGKIALVDRGECTFVQKVLNAQNAGAIAVIVVNNQAGPPINLGGTEPAITIPSIMVSQSDGQLLKDNIASLQVTLTDNRNYLDSSLDNGIIVHEYGHGISNRLTGGPANTSCLGNLEQMGEGWSDYFALVLTMKPGDVATMPGALALLP